MKRNASILIIIVICTISISTSCRYKNEGKQTEDQFKLPDRGLCAHRGAMETHPENTIPAFLAAIESGAHMIEFDVQITKDNKLVVIHDGTVDRTTNGTGRVTDLTFGEIKKLDAGSWKSPDFAGEQIPTLHEVLSVMPLNTWLNIHCKGEDKIGELVAEVIAKEKRLHQSFLACGAGIAESAKAVVPEILICNMDRMKSNWVYVKNTIDMKADFIQLNKKIYPGFAEYAKLLKANGVRINYYGTDSPDEIKALFEYGIDFPLVNDIVNSINIAKELDIHPLKPLFVAKK